MDSHQLLHLISLALLLVTAKLEPANPNVPPPSLAFPANPYPLSPPPSSSSSSPLPVKPNNPPPTPNPAPIANSPAPIKSYPPAPTPFSPPPARSSTFAPKAPAPYDDAPFPMLPPVSSPGNSPAPSPLEGYFAAPPPYNANPPVRSVRDCEPLCTARCRLHSRQGLCMRACSTCCARCKCVPPGTFGNREVCGKCYTDMRTHGNKPKCP